MIRLPHLPHLDESEKRALKRRMRVATVIGAVMVAVPVYLLGVHRGAGPAVRLDRVESLGPAIMGEGVPLRIWGHQRAGCTPLNARSFDRWVPGPNGTRYVERQPIANIAAASFDPPVPPELAELRPARFHDEWVPVPNKLAWPGNDWFLDMDVNPSLCDPWWEHLFGITKSEEQPAKVTIASDGVVTIIDPSKP